MVKEYSEEEGSVMAVSDSNLEKKEVRRQCIAARRALTDTERAAGSAAVCEALLCSEIIAKAACIVSYMNTWDEVCLDAFHIWAEEHGKKISFPISGKEGIMQMRHPFDKDAFVTGKYGIREPDIARSEWIAPEQIDVILVPCVGYDLGGRRVGHGAGYYDRYLPQCPGAVKILVAFGAQEAEYIPTDPSDVCFDTILTENGFDMYY